MSLDKLRKEVHDQLLSARRMERIVVTHEFTALFEILSDSDRCLLTDMVKRNQATRLTEWVEKRLRLEIGDLSTRQLRYKAGTLGIARYSLMSKDELIKVILHEQNRRRIELGQVGGVESDSGPGTQADQKGIGGQRTVPIILAVVSCFSNPSVARRESFGS